MRAFSQSVKGTNNKIGWTDEFALRSGTDRKSPKKPLNTFQQFWADVRDPRSMCAAFRPLLLLSFLTGISPCRTLGSADNRYMETTYLGIANTLFLLILFCTSYVLRVINKESLVAHLFHSKVSRFGEDIQILTSFVALVFTLVLCFLKRKKLCKWFHVMNKIDKKLTHLCARIDYKKISRIVILAICVQWLLFFILICATFALLRTLDDQPDFFEWIFFFLPIAIISTLKNQFYCFMHLIKHRLRYISHLLCNLQEDQMTSSPPQSMDEIKVFKFVGIQDDTAKLDDVAEMKRDKYEIIAELCRTHEELCDASYLAEEYFNHQMLTTVTIEFVSTLFNLYFMLEAAYNETKVAEVDTIAFISYFTFYSSISVGSVYALLRSAESVTAENEMCAIYVHKLLNVLGRHENDTKDLLTRFSMQLLHRKIKFTACGLFPLDNTLIFTMVGAATTYLIILFQVGNAIK